jgi:putative ABC transport system permease protein
VGDSVDEESKATWWTLVWDAVQFLWAHRPETVLVLLGLIAVLALFSRVPISYNALNLVLRWKTAALTVSAFVGVVGLLVAMLAFVNGMYALTSSSGQPGNVILLADGATDEAFSSLAITDVSDIENQPGIIRWNGQPMVSRETYMVVNQLLSRDATGRTKRRFLQLRGVENPDLSREVHGLKLMPGGRWFSAAGVGPLPDAAPDAAPAVEVVLGSGIAREMARDRPDEVRATSQNPDRLEPGDTFSLNDRTWLVVGLLESSGSTYDSEVWAKQSLVGPMFGKSGYSSLVVRAAGAPEAEELRTFFAEQYTQAKLAPIVETKYFESLSGTNQQFLIATIVVAAFTAVGGVFGVMNTMFAAISQRVKDIGVLRLLGYRRRHILLSFLLESMLLAIVGGVLGCAVGALVDGWTANSIVSSGAGGGGRLVVLKLVVDTAVLSSGILLALLMGFIGGLIPSLSAMRLSALEALR